MKEERERESKEEERRGEEKERRSDQRYIVEVQGALPTYKNGVYVEKTQLRIVQKDPIKSGKVIIY
jgi:hypothetical protein